MNNPLGRATIREMQSQLRQGEVRTVIGGNKDGAEVKTIHIERTAGNYIDDFCEAANVGRTNPDVQWVVGASGGMHLQFIKPPKALSEQLKAHAEQERQKWLHRQANPERYVASR